MDRATWFGYYGKSFFLYYTVQQASEPCEHENSEVYKSPPNKANIYTVTFVCPDCGEITQYQPKRCTCEECLRRY